MTRKILVIASSLSIGCATVGSGVGGDRTVNGEVWYTKTTSILFIPVATSIYYCPPHTGHGAYTCYEATVHDHSAGDIAKPIPIDGATLDAPTQPPPAPQAPIPPK